MSKSNTGNTLLALVLGGAIGAAVGILYAPEKGIKTRKSISKKAKKQLKETRESFTENAEKAKHSFEDKLNDTISTASYKADDIISSLESKLADLKKKNAKFKEETTVKSKA